MAVDTSMEAVVEDMWVNTMVEVATREEEVVVDAVVVDVDTEVEDMRKRSSCPICCFAYSNIRCERWTWCDGYVLWSRGWAFGGWEIGEWELHGLETGGREFCGDRGSSGGYYRGGGGGYGGGCSGYKGDNGGGGDSGGGGGYGSDGGSFGQWMLLMWLEELWMGIFWSDMIESGNRGRGDSGGGD
ncbi:hypothetical protein Bca52824_025746 [Brassica carinata]|uniref:Uncharacterized protein n=1 Tax=Brassica carinata TaxID=52824 RepID=A0A8X7SGS8_BRACI|nr:hypothetical protein Bca52824_025746 [Brassica carinata]